MYLQQYPSAYGWQELYLPFVHHRRVRWQSFLLPAALLYWEYLLPDYGYSSSAPSITHYGRNPIVVFILYGNSRIANLYQMEVSLDSLFLDVTFYSFCDH